MTWNHRKYYSLRQQIVTATMIFTIALSIAIALLFFMLSSYYTKQTKLQSIEFNLTLVASTIDTSLSNAEQLLTWSANTTSIRTYLSAEELTPDQILLAYEAASTQYSANQSQHDILRFFITNENDRFLQYGMGITTSQTLSTYTVDSFPLIGSINVSKWALIAEDPLIPSHPAALIAYMPIEAGLTYEKIGSAYLALDLDVITDPLEGYLPEEGSILYWNMTDTTWEINNDTLTQIDTTSLLITPITSNYGLSSSTILEEITIDGITYFSVQCPLGTEGLSISQCIPKDQLQMLGSTYLLAVLGSLVLIFVMSTLLMSWLNHTISHPIARLQRRLSAVGEGDFHTDTSIEWNSEFGDIGRGINELSGNVDRLMTRRLEDQRQHQELEYRMLQSEINPHFIYNTLNSIRWMASIQRANGIAEMVIALSRLLKSISKGNEKLVCLQDELSLLNDYFLIQQYRYGGDLNMDVSYIEDENICKNCFIPRFTLQPIAENAIFHGLEPTGGAGSVLLDIRTEQGDVVICITDNGAGMTQEQLSAALMPPSPEQAAEKFRHVGLWNVHKRIQYSFGNNYGLSIESKLNKGTAVIVRLPYHNREEF